MDGDVPVHNTEKCLKSIYDMAEFYKRPGITSGVLMPAPESPKGEFAFVTRQRNF
jgi:hypothetical protein